jgi:hypothetical protein
MNSEMKIKKAKGVATKRIVVANLINWWSRALALGLVLIALVGLIYSALATAPVLTIAPLGSNQFNIVITNAVTTTNYTLFWTPVLSDQNYPWQVLGTNAVGETNFIVDGGTWQSLFFKVLLGSDSDGDGVLQWQDAQPDNPNVGILSVTIDSPTNGYNF